MNSSQTTSSLIILEDDSFLEEAIPSEISETIVLISPRPVEDRADVIFEGVFPLRIREQGEKSDNKHVFNQKIEKPKYRGFTLLRKASSCILSQSGSPSSSSLTTSTDLSKLSGLVTKDSTITSTLSSPPTSSWGHTSPSITASSASIQITQFIPRASQISIELLDLSSSAASSTFGTPLRSKDECRCKECEQARMVLARCSQQIRISETVSEKEACAYPTAFEDHQDAISPEQTTITNPHNNSFASHV